MTDCNNDVLNNIGAKEMGSGARPRTEKKVLFIATIDAHIKAFHIPYLKWFKEQGWETFVAANSADGNSNNAVSDANAGTPAPAGGRDMGGGILPYCDHKYDIDIQRSPFSRRNLSAYRQLKRIMSEHHFDMVHCHTPMGGVLGRLAANPYRKGGTKVVYTAHGFHFYAGAPAKNWLIYYTIEKWLARRTDVLITINGEDFARAKSKFGTGDIRIVHGVGYDESKYYVRGVEERSRLRREYGYGEGDRLLVFVGELNENKNQGMLIRAIKSMSEPATRGHQDVSQGKDRRDVRLLLVGADSLGGRYQRLAHELGVESQIDFLGFRSDAYKIVSMCDIALSSSLREGLPVNVMEAMACGLPVIATDIRGNRDLVEDGVTGYIVAPNDYAALASKAAGLLCDETLHSKMSLGAAAAAKRYSKTSVLPEMESVYRDIIGSEDAPVRILHAVVNMNRGGAETFIMNLFRSMDRNKITFDFITSYEGAYDDEIRSLGGRVYRIPYYTQVGPLKYGKLLRDFFASHPEYKIVHSHMDMMSGMVLSQAKKAGVAVRIAHSHSIANSGGLFKRIIKEHYGKKLQAAPTMKFACSNSAAEWLFPKNLSCVRIVRNGIRTSDFRFSEAKRLMKRKELGVQEGAEKLLIHVGRFDKPKNQSFLLEILENMLQSGNEYLLLLAGDGPTRMDIERLAEKSGISSHVRFLGVRSDISELMAAADIFLMPSLYEGFGVVLVEAQASGLRCIVSDQVPNEVAIMDDMVKFLPLGDASVWAKEVSKSLGLPVQREQSADTVAALGYDISETASDLETVWMGEAGRLR
ncbi:MAG: glycosyltransferase [Clostridiales Family XIII bacterium]|jgi:glycosyltransferase EpsD|nr:glycosyltransferase [Clostridiales Family XIII bacterium]